MPVSISGLEPSESIRQFLSESYDESSPSLAPTLLGYSCGKDSTACWIAMLEAGIRVLPVYMYVVPGLKFVEDYLAYIEDWFDTPILRYPHPSLYRAIANKLYQPPDRSYAIDCSKLHVLSVDDLWNAVRDDTGLHDSWIADGLRANDSLERRSMFMRYGPMRPESLKVSPIWDWTADETRDYLDSFGIIGPPDYQLFGGSFDGISANYIQPIKEKYPDDYEILRTWFPLIDLDIQRRETYGLRF